LDKTAFEALLAPCRGALERFVFYKTPSRADGEDVLQETLLAAFRKRDSLRNSDSFKAWLMQIAANQIREFYRRRAKLDELPLDELPESALIQTRHGLDVRDAVTDTLGALKQDDAELLRMIYFQKLPQQAVAVRLGVPVGTVKSRLHTAKERFRAAYPYSHHTAPKGVSKGANCMKTLPEIMPDYKIERSEQPPFPVIWEELMGWFILPKQGEKLSWGIYDRPGGRRTESYTMQVAGKVCVHGVDGVEITAEESGGGQHESAPQNRHLIRTFAAQLTDSHCRFLSESHMEGDVKRLTTFLDGDEFLSNWGYGEDNCGNETHLSPKGLIKRDGNNITAAEENRQLLDVVGRYTVTIGGKSYDTVCVMDICSYDIGAISEHYLDQNGRTILWRRFNPDDWHVERYGGTLWSERLPNNERLTVNGKTSVHWYDCITDYIL
jgi:RNA polymerase sigma factor (sigma-70 family)